MKYKDLIEKIAPFAEEEINFTCTETNEKFDSKKKTIVLEMRFFRGVGNNDFIVGFRSKYDHSTFENVGETKIITE